MAEISEFDRALCLLGRLKKCLLAGSVERELTSFAERHPSDRLAALISGNLDLLTCDEIKGIHAAQILVQLVLELEGDDEYRDGFLAGVPDLDLGPIYYCDPGSAFLKSSDCRILDAHEGTVCALQNLNDGRFVSGDVKGVFFHLS